MSAPAYRLEVIRRLAEAAEHLARRRFARATAHASRLGEETDRLARRLAAATSPVHELGDPARWLRTAADARDAMSLADMRRRTADRCRIRVAEAYERERVAREAAETLRRALAASVRSARVHRELKRLAVARHVRAARRRTEARTHDDAIASWTRRGGNDAD